VYGPSVICNSPLSIISISASEIPERNGFLCAVKRFTFLSLAGGAYLTLEAIMGVISESLAPPLDVKLLLPFRRSGRTH
jgi:hypothetical protein